MGPLVLAWGRWRLHRRPFLNSAPQIAPHPALDTRKPQITDFVERQNRKWLSIETAKDRCAAH